MTQRLVPAAMYLTYAEAVTLFQALAAAEMPTLVKSCGPPTLPYGEGKFFQLLLREEDLEAAQPVLTSFSEKQAENRNRPLSCPRCGSFAVQAAGKLPWWRRWLYAGTTVFRCSSCLRLFFT